MSTLAQKNKKKREVRRKRTAEVFTPDSLVQKMLDKLMGKNWEPGITFLDPSCGNGNFLVRILMRKIESGHSPTEALSTIYGLDIMKDSIKECQLRLLKIISFHEPIQEKHLKIVLQNIKWLDTYIYPKGTLDYDMSFEREFRDQDVNNLYLSTKNSDMESVELPVK